MEKTLIIAEIGVNHNGSIDLAKQMVKVAKDCGADIVKFQTFNVDMDLSGSFFRLQNLSMSRKTLWSHSSTTVRL